MNSMGKQFFEAGDFIIENGEKRFELLEPVSFNSKFYIAHVKDQKLDKECLLKYVDCSDASYEINNLMREGNFQFFYPYIEQVYGNFTGIDPNGDTVYGVSVEFIHGSDLCTYRKNLEIELETGEITEDDMEALIFRQMIQYLYGMKYYTQFSHQHYLHRDIKPQNVMITNDGDVKIVDFDYAHISGSTKTQNVIGWNLPFSTGYSSPEVFSFNGIKKMPDICTEIYSAGRLFFFWLNGVEYYPQDQRDLKYDNEKGVGIPASALYCINEDLSYGIYSNIDRCKNKYRGERYKKLLSILDKMCSAPEATNRYGCVDEILSDMYDFLLELYDESNQLLSRKIRYNDMQILTKTMATDEKQFVMVGYKIGNGSVKGVPLYEYSMRNIEVNGVCIMAIYNLDQRVYYYPFVNGLTLRSSNRTKDNEHRINNNDVIIYKDTEISFIIDEEMER